MDSCETESQGIRASMICTKTRIYLPVLDVFEIYPFVL